MMSKGRSLSPISSPLIVISIVIIIIIIIMSTLLDANHNIIIINMNHCALLVPARVKEVVVKSSTEGAQQ